MEQPAKPCLDSLFSDPLTDGTAFKLFNQQDGCGVVIAYNIDEAGNPVRTTLGPSDALLQGQGDYLAYDPFTGEAKVMSWQQREEVSLEGENDFRMLLFLPLQEGKAILGLQENYVSFAAIQNGIALDDGTLLVYGCDRIRINGKLNELTPGGNGLFTIRVQKNDQISMEE
jgi:hypothetical protein